MKTCNILLVDDDIDDIFFMQRSLRDMSADIHAVALYNGRQAIDYLLSEGSFSDSHPKLPDIIVTDINMPLYDGLQLVKKIKSIPKLKVIPLYIITTSSLSEDKKRFLEMGVSGFYTKPLNVEEYAVIFKEILKNSGMQLS